jgi:hypothetical protein
MQESPPYSVSITYLVNGTGLSSDRSGLIILVVEEEKSRYSGLPLY